ncbi:B-cell lymphoma/leukemia 11A-like [Uloborus diversus]|uniref:B-cell lymphoma/leukemia 11A-like n=1 Tax=Uloborus diversus TaxID=327109 RepID=UPI002409C09A|nr:B-cell lymphoma/leukemia 11A-like [Uloborus diversus]
MISWHRDTLMASVEYEVPNTTSYFTGSSNIPPPPVNISKAEAELLQDTLTCGSCQKVFVLSEIVKFIQHKVHSCNKENFILLEDGSNKPPDFDSDRDDPIPGGPQMLSKAPSISAPICNRKGLHHQHLHLHRNRNRLEKIRCDGVVMPQENNVATDYVLKKNSDDGKKLAKEEPVVKEELKDLTLRTSQKVMVNAYTNTIITEPSTYTCSTCKQTFTSAWVLVQHAQSMHGMKIYLVTPYHGSRSSSTPSTMVMPPTGPPPSLINRNTSGLGIPLPPVLPPCSMNGPTHHHHHGVLPQQALSLENHPALQLLRMPLGERQFPPTSLGAPNLFARPSQDFRVDMLATSSSTSNNNNNSTELSQFPRLNHHPKQQHLPPQNNTSLPGLGIGSFESHNPFIERGPLGLDSHPRPPPMSLGFEPQTDFYSQRLRQLAGATSPTTVVASPRKLTPPFTHPPMSSSSQPSTPTSTPQPVLNLHTGGNVTPAPTHQHNNNQAHRGSSASSTSSKNGGATDPADGSPKLLKSWSCEFCGKSFRFQSNLIVHRRSHTGEKPYKCPICRHCCSQASKLKRHMKTHQSSNGKSTPGSENNSLESPRSTPDSTSEAGKERNRERRRSIDEDEDASDGQTADNEEEEEDLDDEEEEEDDEEDLEDLDDSNEVMMAEDLSTRGHTNSTPNRGSPNSDQTDTPKPTSDDVIVNNDNNSSNTISVSNGENGSNDNGEKENSKPEPRHSLLSEVMDKIGLSNIQQYNEAYQKALEESSLKISSKDETETPSRDRTPMTANGPERLNSREEGNNTNTNNHGSSKKSLALQQSMEFGHGFFGAFAYHHHQHHNTFDVAKRLKLDINDHIRGSNDRESLYAGLWLPSVHGGNHGHRDYFDSTEVSRHKKSSSFESALKSVTPTNMSIRSLSPRPSTSGNGGNSVSNLINSSSKNGNLNKEQRRNDTCEYCGKVFKNCSNLTVHRRSHTGEKPYKCELCSYACAQSSKLTRHMKTHGRLGKDVYRCRFCNMPFSVPSTLEKHMRKCVVNQNASGVSYTDRDSDSKDLT